MRSCTFCEIVSGTSQAHKVFEEGDAVAFLDKAPLQLGHVLLVPKEHAVTLADLPADRVGRFFQVAQSLSLAVERGMRAEGTFVAINNRVSQSVPHLHVHIVPRTKGDGLKGFFWPRKKYSSEEEMAATAQRIREALQ